MPTRPTFAPSDRSGAQTTTLAGTDESSTRSDPNPSAGDRDHAVSVVVDGVGYDAQPTVTADGRSGCNGRCAESVLLCIRCFSRGIRPFYRTDVPRTSRNGNCRCRRPGSVGPVPPSPAATPRRLREEPVHVGAAGTEVPSGYRRPGSEGAAGPAAVGIGRVARLPERRLRPAGSRCRPPLRGGVGFDGCRRWRRSRPAPRWNARRRMGDGFRRVTRPPSVPGP